MNLKEAEGVQRNSATKPSLFRKNQWRITLKKSMKVQPQCRRHRCYYFHVALAYIIYNIYIHIYWYISIIIAAVLLLPVGNVLASSGSDFTVTGDNFKASKSDRPAINEDFDPDESCHFDVYQLKCIPCANQECPEGFGNNDDSTCFPSTDCPKDYHWTEDDETGQCYPNDRDVNMMTTHSLKIRKAVYSIKWIVI